MKEKSELLHIFDDKQSLVFFVNGKKIVENNADPECTLVTYLRTNLRLCGTKLGCGEGGCGACTVMVSRIYRETNEIKHLAVNACLTPLCSMHGAAVTTVEGIGSIRTKLHPVQERIAKAHGSQCGFCTPGIVMSMYALLRSTPKPSMKDLEVTFQGNLCRCTGYRPIIEGYRTFTTEYECAMGDKCCKNVKSEVKLFKSSDFTPLDPSQEPIFPPELKLSNELDANSLVFSSKTTSFYRPVTLDDLLILKKEHPETKIVVGNTEIWIEMKFKNFVYPFLANVSLIEELNRIEVLREGIKIGASVTITEMEIVLKNEIEKCPEPETRLYKTIVEMLHWFAGKQIRNVASVGGNVMTGSPISDLNPIFMAAGIELEVTSKDFGVRHLKMDHKFFTSYRKNIMRADEVLVSLFIPKTNENQHFKAYKQAKRRDDDIAIVNAAFNVHFEPESDIIKNIQMAFGGMAPTTVPAPKTSAALKGLKWNSEIVEKVNEMLVEELSLSPDAPGGMILYRRSLTLSLFFKAYLSITDDLGEKFDIKVENREKSGAYTFSTLTPKSSQLFQQVSEDQPSISPLRKPIVHSSAFKQATGEAVYCDDIPRYENELYLALVLSSKAHAKLISIDASEALKQQGVHRFFSAKDLDEKRNKVGPIFQDEYVFVPKTVLSQGQVLGAIVADTQLIAQKAARLVKVEYEELYPIIVTIEDAIANKSFYPECSRKFQTGDVEKAFNEADHVIDGEVRLGGQEHFYLETNCALAIPKDTDELEIFCSTQHPSELQHMAAHVLGLPFSKIVARVKRLGGGFGGKESRTTLISLPVSIAAYTLGRPVRCMLDRHEDMAITGTRHPFYFKYKVAFTKQGIITGADVEIYNNAGYSIDLSEAVLEKAMFHFNNAYYIPNVRLQGFVCRTNLPSNTAFRGFGSPQTMMVGEHMIRDVARIVKKDLIDVMRINLHTEGSKPHYQQAIENCSVVKCFDQCLKTSNYLERRKEVKEYNEKNRWRKRGIQIVPTMFGISYTPTFLNQSGALIHVYSDGSVLLSHGGIEMGQGLHTKMIQVAAATLKIPFEKIHVMETATDKVPNTMATAASVGSDLNGMAVLNACKVILERLTPFKEQFPNEKWDFWVSKAYFQRVSLSTTGFYATPSIGYDWETNTGNPFSYFVFGAGCSEVEIDCLTGDHQVLRTDIVMDLGSSLNPAIDIGQIEGAFMQGYGLYTLEEMIYSPKGQVISKGPGMYKIPGFSDIPGEFNVSLLTGSKNPRAVYASKAVGEPPLFLASSIFFAIKDAISAARQEEGLDTNFKLVSPATASRIRMACQDKFTNKIPEENLSSFTPWNVMP